jgi:hypothetical protein
MEFDRMNVKIINEQLLRGSPKSGIYANGIHQLEVVILNVIINCAYFL